MTRVLFLILSIVIIFSAKEAFAIKYYLFINKNDISENKGQTEKGDIVDIVPVSAQYEPTEAELQRYKVVIADLTEDDAASLLTPQLNINGDIVKAREKSIDVDALNSVGQKEEITKEELNDAKTDKKSVVIAVDP